MAWTVTVKTWITGEIVTAAQFNTELKDRFQHLFDNLLPCGSIVPFAGSVAPSFYLLCQGQGASTTAWPTLFGLIGYTYGGSGTTFNMPDLKGRSPVGVGLGAGMTLTRTLAAAFGAEAVATPLLQHAHSFTDNGHSHAITDPLHDHGVDNGDTGNRVVVSHGSGVDFLHSSGTGGTGTPITVSTINAAGTGVSNQVNGTGISIHNNGAAGATHSTFQPSLALNFLIKAI